MKVLSLIEKEGDSWDEEYKTPGPTKEVIFFTRSLLIRLNSEKILPNRVSQTVEEGVGINFTKDSKEMSFEAYNDDTCGFICVVGKKVTDNKSFKTSLGMAILHIKEFYT